MSIVVLDTNIVSYLMKGHSLAETYRSHLEGNTLAISFMTIAELYEGAYRRNLVAEEARWSEAAAQKLFGDPWYEAHGIGRKKLKIKDFLD